MNDKRHQIRELWERSLASLKAAELLLSDGFTDYSASRAYYAAFYAASALLLSEGKSYSKHSGVLARIHMDYVKTGRLPAETGRVINELSDLRHVGDYGGPVHVRRPDAAKAIKDAGRFVQSLRALLPKEN